MENKTNAEVKPNNPLAIAALVLGIVSVVFSFVYVWIGLVAGIVGIVLAVRSRKNPVQKGLGTAGLVCSIIGTALSGVLLACALCVVSTVNQAIQNADTSELNDLINSLK